MFWFFSTVHLNLSTNYSVKTKQVRLKCTVSTRRDFEINNIPVRHEEGETENKYFNAISYRSFLTIIHREMVIFIERLWYFNQVSKIFPSCFDIPFSNQQLKTHNCDQIYLKISFDHNFRNVYFPVNTAELSNLVNKIIHAKQP